MVMNVRNRKGDVAISTVIWIVLGLAVLVLMIIGFTKGWDFIFKPFDNAPSDLQTYAKACGLYAQGGLSIDFCNYKMLEFNGNDEIVNCRDSRVIASMNVSGNINLESPALACTDAESEAAKLAACNSLASGKLDKVNINGAPCNGVGVNGPVPLRR